MEDNFSTDGGGGMVQVVMREMGRDRGIADEASPAPRWTPAVHPSS